MVTSKSPHDSTNETELNQKKRALWMAILLGLVAFVLQVVGAIYTNSLALMGDTAHVFTDFFSLLISLLAISLAARPTTALFSFGFHRLEVLAAFLNGILLLGVALVLVVESAQRFLHPQDVLALPLVAVAAGGLLLNLLAAYFLSGAGGTVQHAHAHGGHDCGHDHHHRHPPSDRNISAAMLHVLSDALSSLAVVVGATVTYFTQWQWVDPALAIALAAVIFRWSLRLLWESGRVLLEACPRHLQPGVVNLAIKGMDSRIREVRDLHLWEITSGMYAATAEFKLDPMSMEEAIDLQNKISKKLKESFGVAHSVFMLAR